MPVTPQTPDAPAAPAAPAAPQAPTITTPGPSGTSITLRVPVTPEEVSALIAQREELGNQLSSVAARRADLSEQIRNAPEGASRTGLEDRIRVLDQRIVTLETDLSAVGRQLAAARPDVLAGAYGPPQSGGDDFEEGFFVGGLTAAFTLLPIAYLFLRRRWKKKAGKVVKDLPTESSQRLERLEHGMESIAIEIERVSEGQRFVTRLLSEGQGPISARRIPETAAASSPDTDR